MAKTYLVTGGAGFIGSNYVQRLVRRGERVRVLDNLSRAGAQKNIVWLKETLPRDSFEFIPGDVRDQLKVLEAVSGVDVVVHLAGQVAVTTSVNYPRDDFNINALGSLNVLEAARVMSPKPLVIYSSTNKVYGGLEFTKVEERHGRYICPDLPHGVPEDMPLDFHSPYGCSKGAADQYTHDYARIYGIPTVVLRQSCIYGPRQFGMEDQGWVAWFIICAALNRPFTVYGDGKQVRDLLHVDDLMDAFDAVAERRDQVAGRVYNIGGGPERSIAIWHELRPILERLFGRELVATFADWRPGDQRTYISDIRRAKQDLDWAPKISVEEGVAKLHQWVQSNLQLFS
jgi:CDP-paratose 2-epimerase